MFPQNEVLDDALTFLLAPPAGQNSLCLMLVHATR